MKLIDDYPERVVVGFAFWPFVSLLNFTLVRARAVPITHRAAIHHTAATTPPAPLHQSPSLPHVLPCRSRGASTSWC